MTEYLSAMDIQGLKGRVAIIQIVVTIILLVLFLRVIGQLVQPMMIRTVGRVSYRSNPQTIRRRSGEVVFLFTETQLQETLAQAALSSAPSSANTSEIAATKN